MTNVLGVAIIVVVVLVALPVSFLMSGGVVAALVGWALKANGEDSHPGSELTDLNY